MPKSDRYGDVLLLDYTDERSNRAIKKKKIIHIHLLILIHLMSNFVL